VVRNPKSMKKTYCAPSFQIRPAESAKAALEAEGGSKDMQAGEMLVLINQRLNEKTSASGSSGARGRVP
jgi:hypothetical protein